MMIIDNYKEDVYPEDQGSVNMNSNLATLKKYLYRKPSFMNIYEEAVRNALDADADTINIIIDKKDTIAKSELIIEDNGTGFDKLSFDRFSRLGERADSLHKGIGRVVYLLYFRDVNIESVFLEEDLFYKREIYFHDGYDGTLNINEPNLTTEKKLQTKIHFQNASGEKIHDNKYLDIYYIKSFLFFKFLSELHKYKQDNRFLEIKLRYQSDSFSEISLSPKDLPDFNEEGIILGQALLPGFEETELQTKVLYSIESDYDLKPHEKCFMTGFCVDGRSISTTITSNLPKGYRAIFLLNSQEPIFTSSPDRSEIDIDKDKLSQIENEFQNFIVTKIRSVIPEIHSENERTRKHLYEKYPFLSGYLIINDISLDDENKLFEEGLDKYVDDKKRLLRIKTVNNEDELNRALAHSAKVLCEYIIHRELIINRMSKFCESGNKNDETKLHNIIIPKGNSLSSEANDLNRNNVWLLDDKFMSFSNILSDRTIKDLFETLGDTRNGSTGKPDISVVFSGDLNEKEEKSDVVIVELKGQDPQKHDLAVLINQLKERAEILTEKYPNKINRIWYYGVLGLNDDLKRSLYGGQQYSRMFSSDEYWYGQDTFIPKYETDFSNAEKKSIDFFLLSYEALIKDAKRRNHTFLDIIREGIRCASE